MHCLQIFLIFFLLSITFSLRVQNLYSKSYKEIGLSHNKFIHKRDIIKNPYLFRPYTWNRAENNFNGKLYNFIAYQNRKRKANQNRLHKKNNLIPTDDIQPKIDTNRNQFGQENLLKPTSYIHLNQQRHDSKLDQGSQLNQNSILAKISGNSSCPIPKWVNQKEIGIHLPIFYVNPCQPNTGRHCEFIYKNFILKKKFIQCDKSGKALVKSCPQNSKWDKNLQKCSYSYILSNDLCQIPTWVDPKEIGSKLPPFFINHCKRDNKRKCDFIYMKYLGDEKKFIQCDRLGNALVKHCPPSFEWDIQDNQCSLKTTMVLTTTTEQTTTITTEQIKETTFSVDTTVQETTTANTITTPETISIKTTPEVITTTELPCIIPSWDNLTDNGKELPSYYLKPCKPRPNSNCEFTYWGFEIDDSKFIRCDRSGDARLKSCPTSFKWDNNTNQCSPEVITTTELPCIIPSWDNLTDNGKELPSYYLKPCKPRPNSNCEFTYWGFEIDDSKFIQCDRSGNARLKSCPTSFKWDNNTNQCSPEVITVQETTTTNTITTPETISIKTTPEVITTTELPCIIPSWDNLTDNGKELPSYYLKPCKPRPNSNCEFTYWGFEIDDSKFIQCDRSGNARLKSCPTSFKWDNNTNQCSPEVITTTELPCIIPSWDNLTDNGKELPSYYLKPCKPRPNSNCEFTYWGFEIDDSKFIQCDRSGNARLKSCPTSFKWDNNTNQCSPEVITTTELPCIIPSWDNLTDNGKELPSYYLKPCKPRPNSNCEFTYWGFEIDDSKFIQCDRSGNARLKSCPTSFKWDNNTNQCSPEVITTTELPCIIPSWDNLTDNGKELPSYYLKPCKPRPNSNCEFTYWGFEIDDSKFIQCDRSGNARLKSCPTSFKWDNNTNQCSPEVITVQETTTTNTITTPETISIKTTPEVITTTELPCIIPSGVNQNEKMSPLPSFYPNPCTKDLSRVCEFSFKQFIIDSNKFIQCDKFGKASVKSCKQFYKWFQTEQKCLLQTITTSKPKCEIPNWVNQNEKGSSLPLHYPNPCIVDSNRICSFIYKAFLLDQLKFIVCDKDGNAVIKTCPPNFKWINHMKKCSLENVESTTKPQCQVPAWVDEKEKGIPLKPFYPNPCPLDSFRNCEFIYFLYMLDQHKYIQCDRSGNAVIKSCPPSSIWVNHIKQCSIENIMTTPRAACTVPKWMNPNEKGLLLPSIFLNPCKSTSIQTCNYFPYVLNDHKFIECDQYGKAWVKTCPSNLRWDKTLMKCTAMNID